MPYILGTAMALLEDPPLELPTVNMTFITISIVITVVTIELTTTPPCPPVPVVVVCRRVWDRNVVEPVLPVGGTRLNRLAIGPNVRAGRRRGLIGAAGKLCLVLPWVPTPDRLANGPNVVVIGMLLPTQARTLAPNLEVAVQ